MKMVINVPDEIAHYEPELRYFVDTMVQKLHINRHKGFAEVTELHVLRGQVQDEVDEMNQAFTKESQFAFFLECVDVANQAWLVALKALRVTKAEWKLR